MLRNLSAIWFYLSCAAVVFAVGLAVGEYKFPPYRQLSDAMKTFKVLYADATRPGHFGEFKMQSTDVPVDAYQAARLTITPEGAAFPERILVNGGLNEFRELCPEQGCVAVEFDRGGNVIHPYPYRPDAIFAADITDGAFPHEGVRHGPAKTIRPIGVDAYDNGDLLITFQSTRNLFPFAAGLARVDKDGNPLWFRFDYSHHWSTLMEDGTALVPSLRVGDGDWRVPVGPDNATAGCDSRRPQIDEVQLVGGDGQVIRTIDIAATLKASDWSAMLRETTDGCDPLHLNYIDVIRDDASDGLKPGDLVLSLRNLSAFAVVDFETGELRRMVRGTFVQQHAVQHLSGSKFLLFDNWGGGTDGPPSRVLEVDIATGVERRVFPLMEGPNAMEPMFSKRASHIAISPDRTRFLVSFEALGKGFEVELATGRVLISYDSLHDITGVEEAPETLRANAIRARLFGMGYVTP